MKTIYFNQFYVDLEWIRAVLVKFTFLFYLMFHLQGRWRDKQAVRGRKQERNDAEKYDDVFRSGEEGREAMTGP